MDPKDFTYNFKFIPIAATIIYGIGIGLPFALKLLMRLMGSGFFSGSFIEVSNCLNNTFIYYFDL